MTVKRTEILAIMAFVVACGFVIRGAKAQTSASPHAPDSAQTATNSPEPKKAEQQFKNIQVLKGVPAEEIFPTMQFITASLGVECEFCHVQNAFEKDDKKTKQTARKMMEMMFAINQDNFEGHREVTCYSCHRGNAHPQAIPAVMTEETRESEPKKAMEASPAANATENAGPSPDQLLDKYVQAVGGATGDRQSLQPRHERNDCLRREIAAHRHLLQRTGEAHFLYPHAARRQCHRVQWAGRLAGRAWPSRA